LAFLKIKTVTVGPFSMDRPMAAALPTPSALDLQNIYSDSARFATSSSPDRKKYNEMDIELSGLRIAADMHLLGSGQVGPNEASAAILRRKERLSGLRRASSALAAAVICDGGTAFHSVASATSGEFDRIVTVSTCRSWRA
jgi:hypothetical protein